MIHRAFRVRVFCEKRESKVKPHSAIFGVAWIFASGIALAASGSPPNGEWKGEMQCGPTLSGSSEPFANPMTMIIFDNQARIMRETPQVVENLSGAVSESGHVDATGPGQLKSGQGRPWNTNISGQITGTRFEGIGGIYDLDGRKRRDCRVSLSLMAGSPLAVNTDKPLPGRSIKEQAAKPASPTSPASMRTAVATPSTNAASTVPAKATPTLESMVNAFALPVGASYSANAWDVTDSIPGIQWEHKGLRETPSAPFSRRGHVKLDKLAVVTVFFAGVRTMVSEMNISITNNDEAVIDKSDFLKVLNAKLGASGQIRQLRGGCKSDGQVSGSAVYEITMRGKKPVYLLMATDSGGSAPNSRSTTLQFELEPQRRWACTA